MKKIIAMLALLAFTQLYAQVLVWQDNAKNSWIASDKKPTVSFKNGVITTTLNMMHLSPILSDIDPTGANLPGNKLKFVLEARGKGEVQIGIWHYEPGVRPVYKKIKLTNEFKEYTIEHTLPRQAKYIRCIFFGVGEFRNAKLYNMMNMDYSIKAYPAYQMYNNVPEKVAFELYKKDQLVPNAKLTIKGDVAFDPTYGVSAKAYAQRGDTSKFDAVAKNIKIDKPINVLYLGDSLTHFSQGFNHADKTAFFLNKFNPRKVTLYNFAVRGDTSSQTVARLNGTLKDRFASRFADFKSRKYDVAFIFLGHNDTRAHVRTGYKVPAINSQGQRKNYTKIVQLLRAQGVKRIIIISCASLDAKRMQQTAAQMAKTRPQSHALYGNPALLEQFNSVSQALAKELNLEYCDIYTPMKKVADKPTLFSDGTHLNQKGHDFVALETLKYLAKNQGK